MRLYDCYTAFRFSLLTTNYTLQITHYTHTPPITQTNASGVCLVCQHAMMRRRVTKPVICASCNARGVADAENRTVRVAATPKQIEP